MVLSGQDAWRKHKLLSGLWKKPLPHLGTAVGLFAAFCIADAAFESAMKLPSTAPKSKYTFSVNDIDQLPETHKVEDH